jgi:hypothetical protein
LTIAEEREGGQDLSHLSSDRQSALPLASVPDRVSQYGGGGQGA